MPKKQKPHKRPLRSLLIPLWAFQKLQIIALNEFGGKLSVDDVADLFFSYILKQPEKMRAVIKELKTRKEALPICQ